METPDTLRYMLLGFGVIFGSLGVYILSLWYRLRRLRAEKRWLEQEDQ